MLGRRDREDYGCDFPGCAEDFDRDESHAVAIVKNGKIMAFCIPHCQKLTSEEIILKTLDEIYRERREKREAPAREMAKRKQEEREQAFIADLKGSQIVILR